MNKNSLKKCFSFSAMAPDALNAHAMNVKSGGQQPLMRAGWYRRGPMKVTQHMVFKEGPNAGVAKGLRVVCEERFGESAVKGKDDEKQSNLFQNAEIGICLKNTLSHAPGYQQKFRPKIQFSKLFENNLKQFKS